MNSPGAAVDLRVGEMLTLDNGKIRITLESKGGQLARLRIVAPPAIKIEFPARTPAVAG